MFFELKNGKVVVTDQGMQHSSIKHLYDSDHTKGKERFNKMGTYIYYVYDKRTIYKNLSLTDRQQLVCKDVIDEPGFWRNAEQNQDFIKILMAMNKMQFTAKERLLEGVKSKIDHYLEYFNTLNLDEKNHKLYKDTIAASEDLLALYDRLDQVVNKESVAKQVGGGESKLFEDEG